MNLIHELHLHLNRSLAQGRRGWVLLTVGDRSSPLCPATRRAGLHHISSKHWHIFMFRVRRRRTGSSVGTLKRHSLKSACLVESHHSPPSYFLCYELRRIREAEQVNIMCTGRSGYQARSVRARIHQSPSTVSRTSCRKHLVGEPRGDDDRGRARTVAALAP